MIGIALLTWVIGLGSVLVIVFMAKVLFDLIKEFIEEEEWELLVILCVIVGLIIALAMIAFGI